MVDPDVLRGLKPENHGRYRYAVIERSTVRIEERVVPK